MDIVDITFGSLSVYGGGIQLLKLSGLLGIIWFLPNTQQLMFKYKPCLYLTPTIAGRFQWQPSLLSGIVSGVVGTYLIILAIQGKVGEFIYFQF